MLVHLTLFGINFSSFNFTNKDLIFLHTTC